MSISRTMSELFYYSIHMCGVLGRCRDSGHELDYII